MKRYILLLLTFIVITMVIFVANNNENGLKTQEYDIPKINNFEEVLPESIEIIDTPDPYEVAVIEMQDKMLRINDIQNRMEWYIAYKDIIQEYSEILDPPETIYDYFTEDEIYLICRVVETETYQCDFESKVHVANVIFNRLYDGSFGETIHKVITSKNQFVYSRKIISDDTVLAVEFAFEIEDMTNGALFFHSNEKTNSFCGRDFIFTDSCGHNFY